MTSIYSYQTQAVRDLAYSCFSTSLILADEVAGEGSAMNCALRLTPEREEWLRRLDSEPAPLREHLSHMRSHRLGIYFENLWHFFLKQDPAVDLVAHNLPVRQQGRTLGEFDCLYFCHHRQCHVHLELAVKYFLGHRRATTTQGNSHMLEWLGPNSSDRLDLKINHLLKHQIRLSEDPIARQCLQGLGIEKLATEVEIKGDLFESLTDPLPPPPGFNPLHPMQTWLKIESVESYLAERASVAYQLLPKKLWLARAQLEQTEARLTPSELVAALHSHLRSDKRPPLVAALDEQGRELGRFFVTDSDWPSTLIKRPDQRARSHNE